MGKIRVAALGDEKKEKEAQRKADARRETKKSKKQKGDGSDSSSESDGSGLKPEFQKLVDEVEQGESGEKKQKKAREVKKHVRSKTYVKASSLVDKSKLYTLSDAISLVKKTSISKFDGTVELHLNLNPQLLGDKADYRATVSLPHGTGKKTTVVIADEAIIAEIAAGKINFDVLVAHPSMMPKLAKVARILGPKGLMPNPKNGTVTDNPEKKAKDLTHGQLNIKTEPSNPILHMPVGKISFKDDQLEENIASIFQTVGRTKIMRATLSATMGPGVKLQITS